MPFKTERTIKLEHFQNIVAIAIADGQFDEPEIEFLKQRAEEFGIRQSKIHEIMHNAKWLEFVVPFNQEDKEEQLSDIVYMTMIDGDIHPKEYELCLRIAEKLDFDESYLNYIIELTKKLWEK